MSAFTVNSHSPPSSSKTNLKLTKKRKKTLAFRERNSKARESHIQEDEAMDVEDISLAILVVKDHGREGSTEVEVEQMARKSKSGKKEQGLGHLSQKKQSSEAGAAAGYRDRVADAEREDLVPVVVIGRGKKRKRTSDEEAQAEGQQKASEEENLKERKQSRRVDVREGGVGDGERESVNNKQKERFILFVGNLKYTTPLDAVTSHFSKCDPPPSVRLLTPKQDPKSPKKTHKSKGCAFLEFTHRNALQQALKLHLSELDGRIINVELTAGGGGKGENRLKKLQERNRGLVDQRIKKAEKSKDSEGQLRAIKPPTQVQRYSSTSGTGTKPATPKTWSVGETTETMSKRDKKRGKRVKSHGTGVNAIPVG